MNVECFVFSFRVSLRQTENVFLNFFFKDCTLSFFCAIFLCRTSKPCKRRRIFCN
eukprot:UN02525